MVPLKNLSNIWRFFETPLIDCKINIDLNSLKTALQQLLMQQLNSQQFSITDATLYVPVVTLSTNDNAKLLERLKLVLKEQFTEININQKYQQKDKTNIQIIQLFQVFEE